MLPLPPLLLPPCNTTTPLTTRLTSVCSLLGCGHEQVCVCHGMVWLYVMGSWHGVVVRHGLMSWCGHTSWTHGMVWLCIMAHDPGGHGMVWCDYRRKQQQQQHDSQDVATAVCKHACTRA